MTKLDGLTIHHPIFSLCEGSAIRFFKRGLGLLALALTLCSSGQSTAERSASNSFYHDGSGWHIRGRIDEDMAAQVLSADEENLIDNNAILTVRSAGGDVSAALDIAHVVRNKRLRVIVDEYCVSACASYIFLAAFSRHVEPGGLILFHSSPASRMRLYERAGTGTFAANLSAVRRRQIDFFDEVGIDPEFDFNLDNEALIPRCLIRSPNPENPEIEEQAGVLYTYDAYALSGTMLDAYGLAGRTGYALETVQQLREDLRKSDFHSSMRVAFLDRRVNSTDRILRDCPLR